MTGLLDEGKNEFYGRPTYVLQMPDGCAARFRRAERCDLSHLL